MAASLLDVNALVALLWPAHVHHAAAQDWFARRARGGWATTPITQAGFVRIVSNPAFSPDAVPPAAALRLLAANLEHNAHRFWPAALDLAAALARFSERLVGHRQVTDAYLLALALHYRGRLATLDGGIRELCGADDLAREAIELIDAGPRAR